MVFADSKSPEEIQKAAELVAEQKLSNNVQQNV